METLSQIKQLMLALLLCGVFFEGLAEERGKASVNPGFSLLSFDDKHYRPALNLSLMSGSDTMAYTALDLLYPVYQQADKMVFIDLRGMLKQHPIREFNLGGGYRWLNGAEDALYGVYGYYDQRNTDLNSTYQQITLGGEYKTETYGVTSNVYLPVGNDVNQFNYQNVAQVNPEETGLIRGLVGGAQFDKESAYQGVDAEFSYVIPWVSGLEAKVGGYYFTSSQSDMKDISGPMATISYDALPFLQKTSNASLSWFNHIMLEASVYHDEVRGTVWSAGLRVSIPLGAEKSQHKLKGIKSRMMDVVRRDVDIITHVKDDVFISKGKLVDENGAVVQVVVPTDQDDMQEAIKLARENELPIFIDGEIVFDKPVSSAASAGLAGTLDVSANEAAVVLPAGQSMRGDGSPIIIDGEVSVCAKDDQCTFIATNGVSVLSLKGGAVNNRHLLRIEGTADVDRPTIIDNVTLKVDRPISLAADKPVRSAAITNAKGIIGISVGKKVIPIVDAEGAPVQDADGNVVSTMEVNSLVYSGGSHYQHFGAIKLHNVTVKGNGIVYFNTDGTTGTDAPASSRITTEGGLPAFSRITIQGGLYDITDGYSEELFFQVSKKDCSPACVSAKSLAGAITVVDQTSHFISNEIFEFTAGSGGDSQKDKFLDIKDDQAPTVELFGKVNVKHTSVNPVYKDFADFGKREIKIVGLAITRLNSSSRIEKSIFEVISETANDDEDAGFIQKFTGIRAVELLWMDESSRVDGNTLSVESTSQGHSMEQQISIGGVFVNDMSTSSYIINNTFDLNFVPELDISELASSQMFVDIHGINIDDFSGNIGLCENGVSCANEFSINAEGAAVNAAGVYTMKMKGIISHNNFLAINTTGGMALAAGIEVYRYHTSESITPDISQNTFTTITSNSTGDKSDAFGMRISYPSFDEKVQPIIISNNTFETISALVQPTSNDHSNAIGIQVHSMNKDDIIRNNTFTGAITSGTGANSEAIGVLVKGSMNGTIGCAAGVTEECSNTFGAITSNGDGARSSAIGVKVFGGMLTGSSISDNKFNGVLFSAAGEKIGIRVGPGAARKTDATYAVYHEGDMLGSINNNVFAETFTSSDLTGNYQGILIEGGMLAGSRLNGNEIQYAIKASSAAVGINVTAGMAGATKDTAGEITTQAATISGNSFGAISSGTGDAYGVWVMLALSTGSSISDNKFNGVLSSAAGEKIGIRVGPGAARKTDATYAVYHEGDMLGSINNNVFAETFTSSDLTGNYQGILIEGGMLAGSTLNGNEIQYAIKASGDTYGIKVTGALLGQDATTGLQAATISNNVFDTISSDEASAGGISFRNMGTGSRISDNTFSAISSGTKSYAFGVRVGDMGANSSVSGNTFTGAITSNDTTQISSAVGLVVGNMAAGSSISKNSFGTITANNTDILSDTVGVSVGEMSAGSSISGNTFDTITSNGMGRLSNAVGVRVLTMGEGSSISNNKLGTITANNTDILSDTVGVSVGGKMGAGSSISGNTFDAITSNGTGDASIAVGVRVNGDMNGSIGCTHEETTAVCGNIFKAITSGTAEGSDAVGVRVVSDMGTDSTISGNTFSAITSNGTAEDSDAVGVYVLGNMNGIIGCANEKTDTALCGNTFGTITSGKGVDSDAFGVWVSLALSTVSSISGNNFNGVLSSPAAGEKIGIRVGPGTARKADATTYAVYHEGNMLGSINNNVFAAGFKAESGNYQGMLIKGNMVAGSTLNGNEIEYVIESSSAAYGINVTFGMAGATKDDDGKITTPAPTIGSNIFAAITSNGEGASSHAVGVSVGGKMGAGSSISGNAFGTISSGTGRNSDAFGVWVFDDMDANSRISSNTFSAITPGGDPDSDGRGVWVVGNMKGVISRNAFAAITSTSSDAIGVLVSSMSTDSSISNNTFDTITSTGRHAYGVWVVGNMNGSIGCTNEETTAVCGNIFKAITSGTAKGSNAVGVRVVSHMGTDSTISDNTFSAITSNGTAEDSDAVGVYVGGNMDANSRISSNTFDAITSGTGDNSDAYGVFVTNDIMGIIGCAEDEIQNCGNIFTDIFSTSSTAVGINVLRTVGEGLPFISGNQIKVRSGKNGGSIGIRVFEIRSDNQDQIHNNTISLVTSGKGIYVGEIKLQASVAMKIIKDNTVSLNNVSEETYGIYFDGSISMQGGVNPGIQQDFLVGNKIKDITDNGSAKALSFLDEEFTLGPPKYTQAHWDGNENTPIKPTFFDARAQ